MEGIIDHVNLTVSDLARAREFYVKALAPLGITVLMEFPGAIGMGRGRMPQLWIHAGPASYQSKDQLAPITPTHIALSAESRAQVDAFYRAALDAGGRDFGAPGPRPQYHEKYYGAFVLDPDGHDIEAVIHGGA
jgi:catechol 2,3-dioxygenase-like lactoylglutathione lyase family enzyme